jgi:hypothetical protein
MTAFSLFWLLLLPPPEKDCECFAHHEERRAANG